MVSPGWHPAPPPTRARSCAPRDRERCGTENQDTLDRLAELGFLEEQPRHNRDPLVLGCSQEFREARRISGETANRLTADVMSASYRATSAPE